MKTEIWNGYEIRFIEKDGEWWAVATDIAKALGHRDANNALKKMGPKYKDIYSVGCDTIVNDINKFTLK